MTDAGGGENRRETCHNRKVRLTWNVIKEYTVLRFNSPRFGFGSKLVLVITCLVLLLAIIERRELLIFDYNFIRLSMDDYRWLLSAVAQSMAALFGIGGMFTAYILQIFNNRIRESEAEARSILVDCGHNEFLSLSGREFVSKLDEYIKNPEIQWGRTESGPIPDLEEELLRIEKRGLTLNKAQKEIAIHRAFKKLTISGVRGIAVFMSFIIFLSLLALPFSSYLSKLFSGFIFLILILFLIMISLYKLGRFVLGAISV